MRVGGTIAMDAREMKVEMLRMLSATAVLSIGASLAIGSLIVAFAFFLL
jgi:hypothetical protein